jgi:hypothetical protein
MFKIEDQISDNVKDDVSILIEKLNDRGNWNDEAKEKLAKLVTLLEKKGYIFFYGSPYRYHLYQVGNSCLYDIPTNRRGHLNIFRGKRVRIVCVSSGRYSRLLAAGLTASQS